MALTVRLLLAEELEEMRTAARAVLGLAYGEGARLLLDVSMQAGRAVAVAARVVAVQPKGGLETVDRVAQCHQHAHLRPIQCAHHKRRRRFTPRTVCAHSMVMCRERTWPADGPPASSSRAGGARGAV